MKLPDELLCQILKSAATSHADLLSYSLVCTTWNQLINNDNLLWKSLFVRNNWKQYEPPPRPRFSPLTPPAANAQRKLLMDETLERREGLLTGSMNRSEDVCEVQKSSVNDQLQTPPPSLPPSPSRNQKKVVNSSNIWKIRYIQHYNLTKTWLNPHSPIDTFTFTDTNNLAHQSAIFCLAYDHEILITASRDLSLKLWSISTRALLQTLHSSHTSSIVCIHYNFPYILTGSSDCTMILWEYKGGTFGEKAQLVGHTESVLSIWFDQEWIVSTSRDKSIRIWNFHSGKCKCIIKEHAAPVNCCAVENGILVTGSGDRLIKAHSLQTGNLLKSFKGHTRGIATVVFNGSIIISGGSDTLVNIWDYHKNTLLYSLPGHTDYVRSISFIPYTDFFVSGSYDGVVKIWSLSGKKVCRSFDVFGGSRVFRVGGDLEKVFACSEEGEVVEFRIGDLKE